MHGRLTVKKDLQNVEVPNQDILRFGGPNLLFADRSVVRNLFFIDRLQIKLNQHFEYFTVRTLLEFGLAHYEDHQYFDKLEAVQMGLTKMPRWMQHCLKIAFQYCLITLNDMGDCSDAIRVYMLNQHVGERRRFRLNHLVHILE
jgi:hypothetical protein